MVVGRFRFDRFVLDPLDRQLKRDDVPIELNGRYFDALVLLVREQGKLVSKDRFLEQVWSGVPVTDEALTQCVKTLRRQLGDSATNPRFIETIPKHGYRFIAPVEPDGLDSAAPISGEPGTDAAGEPARPAAAGPASRGWREFLLTGSAGTAGGGAAGVIGGLFYGFGGAPTEGAGMGSLSVVLVFICLTMFVGLVGGAGVGFGVAAGSLVPGRPWQWNIVGGALGGLVVGAVVKLIGLDAFNLLLGRTPGDITGAAEGALLGAAVGFGAWLGSRSGAPRLRRGIAAAGLAGTGAGILITLLGGRLMGGSLDLLSGQFPTSRLQLEQISRLFGESEFGEVSLLVTAALEGLLFGGFVAGAMILARRRLGRSRVSPADPHDRGVT